ncbi:MAG: hypothetical protein EBS08_04445 [Cytophagia bacterium]|nr:hypothetical protein [Cytophagia bacterium]
MKSASSATVSALVLSALMVGAAIAFLVAFLLYWVITRTTTPIKKITYMLPDTKTPKPGYEVMTASTEGLPTLKDRATVSFWLYVNEFPDVPTPSANSTTTSTSNRHVWHRGDMKWIPSPGTSAPMVLLQSSKSATTTQKNSLLVLFRSTNPSDPFDATTTDPAPTALNDKITYMRMARGISIDYIPVKRWVHIAVTVDKKSKLMKAYMDGELVKTQDNRVPLDNKMTRADGSKRTISRRFATTDLNGSGDIHIGGRPTSDLGLGFPGLVSNIRFSNWAMSGSDIYAEYKKGPVDNLMAKLGLPAYGLQAPVYKLL